MSLTETDLTHSDDLLISTERYLAKSSLYYLNRYVLGFTDFTEKPHKTLCDWVQHFGSYERELLLMSRKSFKTSAVSIGFTIFNLLNNPNMRILIGSQERSYAVEVLTEVKGQLAENKRLIEINGGPFKGTRGWKEYEIYIAGRTDWTAKEPSVGTTGIDSVKAGPHYPLIILDDPESDTNTSSSEMIQKLIHNYKYFSPMLTKNGKMIVIGTPYAFDALYFYILNTAAERKHFKVLIGQAYKDSSTLPKVSGSYVQLPEGPEGTLLMPSVLTKEFLDDEEAKDPAFFASQYQISIISGKSQEFKQDWFRYYTKPSLPKQLRVYVALDAAYSQRASADYTAIIVGGVDALDNIFILQLVHERLTPDAIIDWFYRIYTEYNPFKMGVETNATQTILKWAFDKAAIERGFLPIFPLKVRSTSKESRIRALISPYRGGKVYHLAADNSLSSVHQSQQVLESQLVRFPASRAHDDAIDAEAMLLELIDVYHRPRKKAGVKKRRYQPIDSKTGY